MKEKRKSGPRGAEEMSLIGVVERNTSWRKAKKLSGDKLKAWDRVGRNDEMVNDVG